MFGRQELGERCVIFSLEESTNKTLLLEANIKESKKKQSQKVKDFYLDTASEHLIKNVSPLLHNPDVLKSGVGTLAVLNWINETISELLNRPKKVFLDEVHHAVVCKEETKVTQLDSDTPACKTSYLHQIII